MQEWQDPFSVRLDRKELEAEQSRKDKKAYRKEGRRLRRISLGIAIITVLIVAGFGVSVFYPDDVGRIFSGMFDFGAQTESGDVSVISADVSDENSAEETNTDETPASEASPAEEETDSGENTQIAETAPENTQNKESNTANEQLTTEPAVETESIYYDASGEIMAYELDGKSLGFPSNSKALSGSGWETADVAEDPDQSSLAAITMYDEAGSTLFFYYPKESDICSKIEVVFASKDTTFMGMNMQTKVKAAEKIFKDADSVETKSYIDGNGQQIFHYGNYTVTVNFANGYVFSAAVENKQ